MMREPAARRDQREITIPSDARPSRRGRPASGVADRGVWSAGLAVASAGAALCRRRPGEILAILVAVSAAGAVSINALGSQKGRHPAPILANLNPRPAPVTLPRKAANAEPASVETKSARTETPRPASKDAIGELIKAAEPARPGDTTASVTPKSPSADEVVAKAQRALVKLGYGPLKTDGVLGAGTRAAIAKFERDRKLPVKGEPTGRTMSELAARAAMPRG
ncbi:peptidoglycan-binding domain-containing protein [Methylobacterium sp.]|uniref:peptidoglycan-binding domain-containing protein n=1 Tax=Methylobacterium sp. TaxID=409 RepID=UPI0034562BBB